MKKYFPYILVAVAILSLFLQYRNNKGKKCSCHEGEEKTTSQANKIS